ncbi:hypothetical protein CFP56_037328 [Quercus suber]|uniref:Uncharacterized protein n=1 Tax=Quercus suber TaxID=58331 RepID=A0AAW0J5E2_QUESU
MNFSVASCITVITRITTLNAPYDDEQMKEIFQLIIEVSILDTVAKVRSCLVMLDLECDELIVEMFQIFFKIIRSIYSLVVFSAMETIMSLDIYKEISLNFLSPLLASVRKETQKV